VRVHWRAATSLNTILVVDDDRDLREALCGALDDSGFQSVGCGDGRQALEYLRSGAPRPAVILLDWMMPVMSGGEFREEQVRDPAIADIPVVVISAHVKADLSGVSLGIKSLLRKPFPLGDLIAQVERYVPRRA
jgi:CheY-like chemotaxis protein